MNGPSTAETSSRWLPRLLGFATAGYGAAVLARPALLAGPCGLTEAGGRPSATVAVLARALGARDLVSGAAMAAAPTRAASVTAIGVRVACDGADAILFGLALPDPKARRNAALVAGGWGLLCAASTLAVRERLG